ncbi:hypothetical protein HN604_02500 [archaeon]|jgi:FKBP-type peptidyl-prolyl cis-trans isomerase 2|nr:hypothetical protein [archaeon]MBT6182731.1 hypothetical protein [archaeon]MBT6606157.1 hypothetical protein [archaeon]MBT7252003.1 hypothetical protein [archaeon]MBT7660931.1 hypothetical protein [archaeon]
MTTKKNDFIEVEFTAKLSDDNEIFDTNIQSVAKKAELNTENIKPFILSIGNKMLPSGFDEDLIGKEVEKDYSINLVPENAFGKRDPKMVRMIPTKLFHEQNIDPIRGTQLSLDGQLVRVLSSSGGRTLIDFNNPLAGKNVTYDYKITRTVTDEKEKTDALQEFLFKQVFKSEISNEKVIFSVPKNHAPLVKMFIPKFEEILDKKIEVVEIEESKKE